MDNKNIIVYNGTNYIFFCFIQMDVESSKFTRFVIKLDSVSNRNDVLVKKHLLSINLSPIQLIIGKKN